MITIKIPRLPGMKYAVELRIKYAGWGKVLHDALAKTLMPW